MKTLRSKAPVLATQEVVDGYFDPAPDYPYADGTIDTKTIPIAARTAAEFIHIEEPDVVIAADRGGRMMAFATWFSWQHRFPNDRFPTRDRKIHFARLSGKEFGEDRYDSLVRFTLNSAGLLEGTGYVGEEEYERNHTAKVTLIDDWIYRGRSYNLFARSLGRVGIPESNI